MVILSSPPQEPFRPLLLGQIVIVWTSIVGTIGVLASLLISSPALSVPSTSSRTSLMQVGEWIDQTGKVTVMRGSVAHALGFPDVDLRVRERGFRNTEERLTHVCSTSDLLGYEDMIFLASVDENTGDAVVWRATRSGHLIATARFTGGTARQSPNEEAQTAFTAEKEYLIRQMRAQAIRTSPARTPKPESPSEPAQANARSKMPDAWKNTALPPELVVILLNPWLLPIIAIAVAVAAHRAARTR